MNNPILLTDCSGSLGKLAKALSQAQAVMRDAVKDGFNPGYKNKYATLAAVRLTVTKPLVDHGFSVTQTFEPHGEIGVCVVTWLLHESGEWIRSRLFMPVTKKDAQGFGSAISYGRRYALAAICGIASDDDDDANAAVGKPTPAEKAETKAAANDVSKSAEDELARLFDAASSAEHIAVCEAKAAEIVRSGALNDAARARLREKRKAAVERVSGRQAS